MSPYTSMRATGETLPMTIDAEACLGMTLAVLSSRLAPADVAFVRKAMKFYGDLRVAEDCVVNLRAGAL
jgi:hypothetical protein